MGLISDTHGLLRPEALAALAGVARILHAGDVGRREILDQLAELAPVTAVRGNVDEGRECGTLPLSATVEVDGVRIHLIHDLHDLDADPAEAGFHCVVFGHTHQPLVKETGGVLYVNPGSAGPRRFRLPVSAGKLLVKDGTVRAEWFGIAQSGPS